VSEFDELADHYDETRGGEQRGDEYAADIDRQLPAHGGTILEIGVGTGVVALGLRRRGRSMVGLDLSRPMLAKGRQRLGPVVVRSDAMAMAIASDSVAHAVSVWVVHSVADPTRVFHEAARVIRPGGYYIVCTTQDPGPDDVIGQIIRQMGDRVDARRRPRRPRSVSAEQVLGWGREAGFTGSIRHFPRQWVSSPADELRSIALRTWPALRELDESTIEKVTRPAITALESLPPGPCARRVSAAMTVLQRA
jgi:ubiquinone/menaquinone biosynthesis C-methylase UbiE